MIKTIAVTQECINNGVACSGGECPIALAIIPLISEEYQLHVEKGE
jgi:hypothetical protein